jgi:predicted GIY-YIG superfamily endonuclease
MYGQQASIDPSLAALLQTAQMVTPDQTPTVAAQVAQAAQQKMQPQGITQGMPQARQEFQQAMPSMMRNMQQQQMQQMVQQAMQPKPAGIEGLQSNIRMAEGGVVGYAGPDGSSVEVDESQLSVSERLKRDLRRLYEGIETGYMKRAGATPEQIAQKFGRESPAAAPEVAPQAMQTEAAFATPRIDQPSVTPPAPPMAPEAQRITDRQVSRGGAPRPPSQRPPAPAPAMQPAPQGGIAELVAPTPESAMASARSVIGMPGTEGLRKKEEAFLAALKAQPATGQQGLAALQAQQAALQAMNEKAEKESNINSAIQWLLGGREGAGGSARSSIAFSEREDARRRSYNDLQVANATKRDAIIDLQNARDVGNAKAALEAEQRIRAAEVDVAKAEATLAGQFASSNANVYGAQMQSRDAALNREAQMKLEEYRRQTQLMKPKEQDMVSRLEALKLSDITGGKPETATPAQKLQALRSAIQDSRGTGVEERTDLGNLRLRAKIIQDELKEIMVESPRKQQLQRELDGIYRQLGGSPTGAPQGTVDKNNPLLK